VALVALGVTGGISAYKAVEVARLLQKAGHDVVVTMTRSARRFVAPLTFEAITQRRVITSQWRDGANADIEHIALASDAALVLVAPATAHTIARAAHGLADDFLTNLLLATRAPVLMAPAMNTFMYDHSATQANLQVLRGRGVRIVEPDEGYLACGWVGKGRLAEPATIVAAALEVLGAPRDFEGRSVVVSAGPTYEDIDPVRYIGNRSSGRMGIAVAQEAARRGARVTLVLGPTSVVPPPQMEVVRVRSAADMRDAVLSTARSADAVVMAAAVADYRLAGGAATQKMKKQADGLVLTLERTADILADLGQARGDASRPVLVGFAAETEQVQQHALQKLDRKGVDLIVANDVSRTDAGFEVDMNQATFVTRDSVEPHPLESKDRLAVRILDWVSARLAVAAEERPAHG
jgi:phosphopantothenoylcysteine decarboxylase / phosphopantothenate---cysteine ligase